MAAVDAERALGVHPGRVNRNGLLPCRRESSKLQRLTVRLPLIQGLQARPLGSRLALGGGGSGGGGRAVAGRARRRSTLLLLGLTASRCLLLFFHGRPRCARRSEVAARCTRRALRSTS